MKDVFIYSDFAAVGYDQDEASVFHALLERTSVGDVVYLKSNPPNIGLIIYAVGIVTDDTVRRNNAVGSYIKVAWIWRGVHEIGKVDDKFTGRLSAIYEELNPNIQKTVVNLLLSHVKGR